MNEVIENNLNENNSELSETEYQKNLAIFEDIKIPFEKFDELTIHLNDIMKKMPYLNFDKQSDMNKIQKKIEFLFSIYREMNNNYLTFFNKCIVDVRKNIKLEKKRKNKKKIKVNILLIFQKMLHLLF